jgi:hypothetical protein
MTVSNVIRNVGVGHLHQSFEGRVGRSAGRRQVVLQRTGGPRLRRLGEDHDPQAGAAHDFPLIGR